MKKLLTYITAAALLISLGSCSQEDGSLYDFTLDPSTEATFAAEELSFDGLTADLGGKISVPMYRGNTAEAASVPVTITGGEGTFTPSKSTFDFAAGENVAYIDFTFDFETMSPAPVTISIVANNEEDISDNGYGATELVLQKQLTYSSLGIGYYYSAFGGDWEQEILKAEDGNYFLIPSAWVSGTDFSFYFDGQTLDWYTPSTGYESGYGPFLLNILSWKVVSQSPLTLYLEVTYNLAGYVDDPFGLGVGYEVIEFPEGFTLQ